MYIRLIKILLLFYIFLNVFKKYMILLYDIFSISCFMIVEQL